MYSRRIIIYNKFKNDLLKKKTNINVIKTMNKLNSIRNDKNVLK